MAKFLTTLMALVVAMNSMAEDGRVVTSFDAATADLGWRVVNDNVMGGRSSGGFELSDGSLVFSGVTNTNGGGFASIRSTPRQLDLGEFRSLGIRFSGDGRTYTFRLKSSQSRIAYWAEFPTKENAWQEIVIPIASFQPRWRGRILDEPSIEPSDINEFGIMIYDGQDGPFRLVVDSIKVFQR
jgi:hypothetical protein